MIAIVDYGMGNLRSVEKGFQKVGVDVKVTSNPRDIDDADGIVLPGVGAFRDCMKNLTDMSLTEPIVRAIQKGNPYLGICLGLQILFTESEEFGLCKGLNIFNGKVVRFRFDSKNSVPPTHPSPSRGEGKGGGEGLNSNLKIPHMGWNNVKILRRPPIFDGIQDEAFFYFVHSFYVVPDDNDVVATTTEYGITFTSMVWKENIFAMQFHPEKSQELGLKVLKGFGDFVKKA
ncbi:MAG: imidazole glycerol phosphate synthase subunit HisH [Nitrospirae bacterium]|nr:imidazole glycerol phosphate synthase subunit HisH [Nitrospirota bacterium]